MTWPAQTPSPNPPRAAVMAVVGEVASDLRVPSEDICGLTTARGVAKARHEVWRRLKAAGWTNSGIARTWGCHPSSISTAVQNLAVVNKNIHGTPLMHEPIAPAGDKIPA